MGNAAYPRHQRSRDFKFATRSAGSVTISSVTYTAISTALDLTLSAQSGDVVEVGVSALWDVASVAGYWTAVDAATIVSGAAVSYISGNSSTGIGVMGWFVTPGDLIPSTGSYLYPIVAGDLSTGTVTLRLLARNSAASTRVVRGTNTDRLQFWAKNLGPQDPS